MRTRRHLLWQLLPIPLALYLFSDIQHVLLQFNQNAKAICRSQGGLIATYDALGLHSFFDQLTCVLVRFCSVAVNNHSCAMVTFLLLGQAAVMYAVMAVEGYRQSQKTSNAVVRAMGSLLPTALIYLGNVVGAGPVTMLLWLPLTRLLDWLSRGERSNAGPIPATRLLSIFLSSVLGQLPIFLLAVYLPPSRTQSNWLAIFQHTPFFFPLVQTVLDRWNENPEVTLAKRKKGTPISAPWRASDLYLALSAVNVFLYWLTVIYQHTIGSNETSPWTYLKLLWSPPGNDLAIFDANPEMDQFQAARRVTYMLLWDWLAMVITFGYWVWLHQGTKGLWRLFKYSVIGGPSGGLALAMCEWELVGKNQQNDA
ncbi:hypothetical protein DM01DRAFT_325498 [Hesseltinella vesiculosa]|uniref:Uncharacterized protein n=1 Tax=Hesseltinella vesiculosa TaxID=101127 RepID=A0A1X2GFP2_9FUNG|nr:hypothetical protein DM01DRAFT_325498 [Hesseltinella vesiculosa]